MGQHHDHASGQAGLLRLQRGLLLGGVVTVLGALLVEWPIGAPTS